MNCSFNPLSLLSCLSASDADVMVFVRANRRADWTSCKVRCLRCLDTLAVSSASSVSNDEHGSASWAPPSSSALAELGNIIRVELNNVLTRMFLSSSRPAASDEARALTLCYERELQAMELVLELLHRHRVRQDQLDVYRFVWRLEPYL